MVRFCTRIYGLCLLAASACAFCFQMTVVHSLGHEVCPVLVTCARGTVGGMLGGLSLLIVAAPKATVMPPKASSESTWIEAMRLCTGPPQTRRWLLVRAASGFIGNALEFLAASKAESLGDVTALIFTMPLFAAALAALFLRENLTIPTAFSTAIGLGGIVLLTRPSFLGFSVKSGSLDASVCALALGAAFHGGFYFVLMRFMKEVHFLTLIMYGFGGQAFFGFAFGWLMCGEIASPMLIHMSLSQWAALFLIGAAAFMGQLAVTIGAQMERAAVASAVRALDVPLAYMMQILLFRSEVLSLEGILGSALVCISVLMLVAEKLYKTTNDTPSTPKDCSQVPGPDQHVEIVGSSPESCERRRTEDQLEVHGLLPIPTSTHCPAPATVGCAAPASTSH